MESSKYSLRQIVDMTGISEFTLRGWELRYAAFEPSRTETGRRLYSHRDLQKALLLRELIKRGHRIGDVAGSPVADLKKLMGPAVIGRDDQACAPARHFEVEKVMRRVALQEWETLESEITKIIQNRPPMESIQQFIIPLFAEMGAQVAEGLLSIAQEHILSALLKQQLHFLAKPVLKSSKHKILMATPEGDFHEMGLLTAQAMASQLQLRSVYLGPNSPKKDVCETALRAGVTHVLLAATVNKKHGSKDDFYSYINFLDQNLPPEIEFWLAGRAAGEVHLKRKFVILNSLQSLETHLSELVPVRRTRET